MHSFNVDFIRNPGVSESLEKYLSFTSVESILCYPDEYVIRRRTALGYADTTVLTKYYTLAIVSAF